MNVTWTVVKRPIKLNKVATHKLNRSVLSKKGLTKCCVSFAVKCKTIRTTTEVPPTLPQLYNI